MLGVTPTKLGRFDTPEPRFFDQFQRKHRACVFSPVADQIKKMTCGELSRSIYNIDQYGKFFLFDVALHVVATIHADVFFGRINFNHMSLRFL